MGARVLKTNRSEKTWAAAYLIVVVGMVILFISDAQQNAFDDRRGADIDAANAKTIHCVFKALRSDADQTRILRAAAERRDADLIQSMQAMKALVQRRVLEGIASDGEVREAARQFIFQADEFVTESHNVTMARHANPVPKTICGVKIR